MTMIHLILLHSSHLTAEGPTQETPMPMMALALIFLGAEDQGATHLADLEGMEATMMTVIPRRMIAMAMPMQTGEDGEDVVETVSLKNAHKGSCQ